jgi:hypothetical protein
MNSLGWSRRADIPVNTSQQTGLLSSIKSLNPFSNEGYVRLPTTEGAGAPLPAPSRREEEEGWFTRESSTRFYLRLPTTISPASAILTGHVRHSHFVAGTVRIVGKL